MIRSSLTRNIWFVACYTNKKEGNDEYTFGLEICSVPQKSKWKPEEGKEIPLRIRKKVLDHPEKKWRVAATFLEETNSFLNAMSAMEEGLKPYTPSFTIEYFLQEFVLAGTKILDPNAPQNLDIP